MRGLSMVTGTILATLVVISPVALSAQNPVQKVFTSCPGLDHVFKERDVQVAAVPIVDTARSPKPVAASHGRSVAAALIVDTTGVPERGSLVPVRGLDSLSLRRLEAAYQNWRFEPALASGCKVRQEVRVSVVW